MAMEKFYVNGRSNHHAKFEISDLLLIKKKKKKSKVNFLYVCTAMHLHDASCYMPCLYVEIRVIGFFKAIYQLPFGFNSFGSMHFLITPAFLAP